MPGNESKGIRIATGPSDLEGDLTRQLYTYCATEGGTPMPASRFDVLDLPNILPMLFVADVIDKGRDYRSQFIGTGVAHLYDLKEQIFLWSEIESTFSRPDGSPSLADNTDRIFATTLQTEKPVVNGPKYLELEGKRHIWFESLTVPLASDSGEIVQLAGVLNFFDKAGGPD